MHILLCAATKPEIAPTLQWLNTFNKHRVEGFITGVGLMATTYSLTKALSKGKYELVIQAGIAGSLNYQFQSGEVTIVASECVGDLGVFEHNNFRSLFDLNLSNANSFPYQDGKLINPHININPTKLPFVHSVSVNEISTSQQRIDYYKNKLNADIEAMEGAALHYVCLMEEVPFLQLRAISNVVGERDKNNWKMKEAIANLNIQAQTILSNIEHI